MVDGQSCQPIVDLVRGLFLFRNVCETSVQLLDRQQVVLKRVFPENRIFRDLAGHMFGYQFMEL
jgi:hypothetical protein